MTADTPAAGPAARYRPFVNVFVPFALLLTAANLDAETGLVGAVPSAGANPTPLYEQLFECAPLARLKLIGQALSRMQVRAGGKVAFTEVFLSDYGATGAVPGDTEDMINYPRSIEGVRAAFSGADRGYRMGFEHVFLPALRKAPHV